MVLDEVCYQILNSKNSSEGKHLLAHELTHVVQQNSTKKKSSELTHAKTGGKRIQGGFFGDVWEGVKDVDKAIGEDVSPVLKR